MPRQFELLVQHYIDDKLLEAGEIIGEGTSVPFLHPDGSPRPPSTEMRGLDKASQAEVEKVQTKAGGYGVNPMNALPTTMEGTI